MSLITLATDSFTRADGTGLGANWTTQPTRASMNIASNAAVPPNLNFDAGDYWNGVSWPNDQWASVVLGNMGSGPATSGSGCLLRQSASVMTCYRAEAAAGHITIEKFLTGTFSTVGTVSRTNSFGDTLFFSVIGTTLNITMNGVLVLGPLTDAGIAAGNVGVSYSSTDTVSSVLAWSGGGFGASSLLVYQNQGGF